MIKWINGIYIRRMKYKYVIGRLKSRCSFARNLETAETRYRPFTNNSFSSLFPFRLLPFPLLAIPLIVQNT